MAAQEKGISRGSLLLLGSRSQWIGIMHDMSPAPSQLAEFVMAPGLSGAILVNPHHKDHPGLIAL